MNELVTDLDTIRLLAEARRDAFEVMRYMIEDTTQFTDAEIDALAESIAAPVIAAIDCTRCAHCCRALHVYLTPPDAERLAAGIHVPLESILQDHVQPAPEAEEWGVFRQRPCPFLNGTLCSVYAHRPESCRLYPVFTPDFRWTLADTLAGAALCPIIYNVLDRLAPLVETWG